MQATMMPPDRVIAHVDMDAFYASVEQRDEVSLRNKPVIVGGRNKRGVVCAASYEARKFGVHSAMPMAVALRKCPGAIVRPPRMEHYGDVSAQLFDILGRFSPLVEPLSLDEAFLDLTGTERLLGTPEVVATQVRKQVADQLDLPCSVGIAPSKLVAKIASARAKPAGQLVVTEAAAFLAPLPVSSMWGIGKVAERTLSNLGISTLGQLTAYPESVLAKRLGQKHARSLLARARGQDDRLVDGNKRRGSVSCEQTYADDLVSRDALHAALVRQAEELGYRLRRRQSRAQSITVKVRFDDFRTITRSRRAQEGVMDDQRIMELATSVAAEINVSDKPHARVRLTGIAAKGLIPIAAGQLCLDNAANQEQISRTLDEIRARFGQVVKRATSAQEEPTS